MAEKKLQKQLQVAANELARLRAENQALRKMLGIDQDFKITSQNAAPPKGPVNDGSTNREKVSFFLKLFQGRGDTYAVRWTNRKGKAGYSPACKNEWTNSCGKGRKVSCADCHHRSFLPLDAKAVARHLRGQEVIGTYPLLPDETCRFLAIDFDDEGWQGDALALRACCEELGIPVAVERSRSGEGAHLWFFFSSPIPASLAREFGSGLLTSAMEKRHQLSFSSYDRLFPNQDTMPKGGFGNLIALPLQREARVNSNSVFVDEKLEPYPDQWQFLSSLRILEPEEVKEFAKELGAVGTLVTTSEEPWKTPKPVAIPKELVPEQINCVLANMIYIEKAGVPQLILNRITRLAAFANPEFYRAQAMRLPTYDKPRIISLADTSSEKYLALPRGCKEEFEALMHELGARLNWQDETNPGKQINLTFQGELRPLQQEAATALLEHNNGVLAATTAFGKTVVAAWLIAERKTNVLVVVHRRQLLDQWKIRLSSFLGLEPKSIGEIGGGKKKRTGLVDIALIQSLNRKGEIEPYVRDYGMIIVDECHHISAFSFEQVLKYATARYIYGLTATTQRKDGQQPIVFMQCGPVRLQVDGRHKGGHSFAKTVIPRKTNFQMPLRTDGERWQIHEIYAAMVEDEDRNKLICQDVAAAIAEGFSPLILTERTAHLEKLAELLVDQAKHVLILRGGMGKKQRQVVDDALASISEEEPRVLLATGRYIGEGFDDARLDALFLAMPISWKGTLVQYAGRLHREHDQKREVRIYDYLDLHEPMLLKMYQRRLKGYESMGYLLEEKQGFLF